MDINSLLITIISALGGSVGIVGIVKAVLNFIESKLREPQEVKFNAWLSPDKLFTALQNTYQTFTKKLTDEYKTNNTNWIDEAKEIAFQNIMDIMPNYINNLATKVFKNKVENKIKQELQNYYEKHKSKINKDIHIEADKKENIIL